MRSKLNVCYCASEDTFIFKDLLSRNFIGASLLGSASSRALSGRKRHTTLMFPPPPPPPPASDERSFEEDAEPARLPVERSWAREGDWFGTSDCVGREGRDWLRSREEELLERESAVRKLGRFFIYIKLQDLIWYFVI